MIIAVLIAFCIGIGVGALLQAHLAHHAMLRRQSRARELEDHPRDS